MMRGKASNVVAIYSPGITVDRMRQPATEYPLWKRAFAEIEVQRGGELELSNQIQQNPTTMFTFDYMELMGKGLDGKPFNSDMIFVIEGDVAGFYYDVDNVKPDYTTRKKVVVMAIGKAGKV